MRARENNSQDEKPNAISVHGGKKFGLCMTDFEGEKKLRVKELWAGPSVLITPDKKIK